MEMEGQQEVYFIGILLKIDTGLQNISLYQELLKMHLLNIKMHISIPKQMRMISLIL